MQRGITIARKGTTFDILVMPDVDFAEQRRNFKQLRAHLEGYDEVELWSSGGGRVKRYRFKSKVTAVVPPGPKTEDTTTESETPVSIEPVGEALPASPAPVAPKAKQAKKSAKPAKGRVAKKKK